MRRLFLLTLLGLLGACAGCATTEPSSLDPLGTAASEATFFAAADGTTVVAYRLTPSATLMRWYHQVERCAQLAGHVERVKWYVTPRVGVNRVGEWRSPHTILLEAAVLTDSSVVMHETLHDLLYQHGWRPAPDDTSGGHPAPYFMPGHTGCATRYYTAPTPSE